MVSSLNLGIAIYFLVFLLILRILLFAWQKIALLRTGQKFKFLLLHSPFAKDITWQDVKYSVFVIVDSAVTLIILIWVISKIF